MVTGVFAWRVSAKLSLIEASPPATKPPKALTVVEFNVAKVVRSESVAALALSTLPLRIPNKEYSSALASTLVAYIRCVEV